MSPAELLGGFLAGVSALVTYHALLALFGWRFVHRDQMLQQRRRRRTEEV